MFGGDRVTFVPGDLASRFTTGDRLVVVHDTGDLLHVPAAEHCRATAAVDTAMAAFEALGSCTDAQIDAVLRGVRGPSRDATFGPIASSNRSDVERATATGRSTTRLELSPRMRADMIAGLRTWRDAPGGRDRLVDTRVHNGSGRRCPTCSARRRGVRVRGTPERVRRCGRRGARIGNTAVFRIGSDALGTARAIVEHALDPALTESGLPTGTVALVDSAERSAGWALFGDRRLALAVARGSGPAVAQLGAVARQAGIAVSLHGTGGAWIVAGETADTDRLHHTLVSSLDRKVCNTVNVCCVSRVAGGRTGARRDRHAARGGD